MYGDYFNPYNYSSNNQWQNPINRNRQEIIKVNGKNGAEAYQMMPNSQALLLDETEKIISVLKQKNVSISPDMLAIYDYLHKKQIEKREHAIRYQELYKK